MAKYDVITEPADRIPITSPGYGRVLRELREYEELSQMAVAKKCYIHKNTLSLWEREVGVPTLDVFIAAVKAFGYHVEIVRDGK